MSLPVVVVVATHDAERLGFLTGRCLPSIAKQTSKADLVIVVSDNDPSTDFLNDDHIRSCFDADDQKKVRLIPNNRTRGNSGTGSWNSGILSALASFGHDCFVAFLDDDDEWENNHLETCLKAANENSMWVVSGIVRISASGKRYEHLLESKPTADDFFTANPGIQGSNLFVRVSALLGAGLFE